ncbi:MAG: hypothetical protein AAGH89_05815 [Verrucomicrobiota bacterium]
MRQLSLIIAFVLVAPVALAEEREFSRKTLHLEFPTFEEAQKWSLRTLGFKEWLEAVSRPEWIELHKSESDDFYFVIYRSEDHLIFCENDRKDAYRGASTSIRATDDEIAYTVWEKPSMWTTIKWDIDYPSGGYGGQETFVTWKVIDGFSGDIVLNYRVSKEGAEKRQVLLQTVPW